MVGICVRAEDARQGISKPRWREAKVACCQTMTSSSHAADPHPEPLKRFLDPIAAGRLAAEIKSSRGPAGKSAASSSQTQKDKPKRRRKRSKLPSKLVRTVIATLACSELFGWEVAAEVMRRGRHFLRTGCAARTVLTMDRRSQPRQK
jgi:hypothetical protein